MNPGEVALLTLLKSLIALEVLLPIGLFFGLILGLGKLHNDSEIIAMRAGGISELQMTRPVAALAIPLALVIAWVSMYARPWAWSQIYEMRAIAEASSDIARVKPGQFYLTSKTTASGGQAGQQQAGQTEEDQQRAIFIEKISPEQALEHIFIRTRIGDELQIISSQTGRLVARPGYDYQALEMDNARIFKQVDDGPDLFAQIEHFTMKVADAQPDPLGYKSKSAATVDLASSVSPKDQAEYQWRLSNPVTTLLLALLAIPLSRSKPRQGRYARLLLAFVIYAAYYNLIGISRTWVEQQAATSIWWTPILLALLVALFYVPWRALGYQLARGK